MPDPILLDIPESIETDRLLIRPPRPGEGAQFNAAILETFDDLHAWMPWAAQRPTLQQSEEFCRRCYSQFFSRQDITLALMEKSSGTIVGCSGLHPSNWNVPSFEIGYWCRKRFQNNGFITEAVGGILKLGFETLHARRIEIRCDSRNQRSARVPQRLGMPREGILRHQTLAPDGSLRDTLIFAFTDDDWKSHV